MRLCLLCMPGSRDGIIFPTALNFKLTHYPSLGWCLSLEEVVMMADSYMPKPAKRGPHKKQEKTA